MTGVGVNDMQEMSNSLHDADLADSSQGMSQFWRKNDNVVFADGNHFNAEGELVVVNVTVGIVRDELLGVLIPDWDHGLEKLDQLFGSRLVAKVKVQTVWKNENVNKRLRKSIDIYVTFLKSDVISCMTFS